MAIQTFLYSPGDTHKRHLEILRQIILGGGGGGSSPSPGPGPGPEPEPTPEIVEEKDVTFYDWDGTVLYSYSTAEALTLDAMPEIPDRSSVGLYDGVWNWTLEEMKECVRDIKMCAIGANYETIPNRTIHDYPPTYIDVKMDIVKTIDLKSDRGGTFTFDWGDGTRETITLSANGKASHTYSDEEKHTIKIEHGTGSVYNFSIPDSSGWCILSMRLGEQPPVFIGGHNLESINIPPSYTGFTNLMFIGNIYHNQCPRLKHLTLPRGIGTTYQEQPVIVAGWGVDGGMTVATTYNMYKASGGAFGGYYSLLHNFLLPSCRSSDWPAIGPGGRTMRDGSHGMPQDIKSFPPSGQDIYALANFTLQEGIGLKKLRCGSGVTTLKFESLSHTESADIYIPSSVTKIDGGDFIGRYNPVFCARSLHLQATTPPTIGQNSDQLACRIYVPAEAVYIYKQATNWSVYSDFIFAETEEVIW